MGHLRALQTLPKVKIHYGNFLVSEKWSGLVQPPSFNPPIVLPPGAAVPVVAKVYKTEEKGSDVNLGAHLLRDAFQGACRCAVIISNDSDLLTPIRIAKADCGMKIGLVLPRAKGSVELKRLGDFQADPRKHYLVRSQFPAVLTDATGQIHKPQGW